MFMCSDVLDELNNLYRDKEAGWETEGVILNAKNHKDGRDHRLCAVDFEDGVGFRVIGSVTLPDELLNRLVNCAREYAQEKGKLFSAIKIEGLENIEED